MYQRLDRAYFALGAVVAILISLWMGQQVRGDVVTLNAVDRGFYNANDSHDNSNLSYIAGPEALQPDNHNFFVFNLAPINTSILAAELRLFNPSNGYSSNDGSETFALFDVSTDISTLVGGGTVAGAYSDLGGGTGYGSVVVNSTDVNTIIVVPLNGAFVTAANNASGLLALGGALTSLSGGLDDEYVFGFTQGMSLSDTQLVLTLSGESGLPEPATAVMLGAAALLLLRRRRQLA